MKAADFLYHRPRTVAEAVALLHDYGGDARILAGGQSLMPMVNMRLMRPAALIDINAIEGLDAVDLDTPEGAVLGTRLRYSTIETAGPIAARLPLLAQAARHVGDRQVRNRGTIGGSLVQADPAGNLPLAVLTLGARLRAVSRTGSRDIAIEDFFQGSYATALHAEELLTSIVIPRSPCHFAYAEIARRHNDFAVIAVAVVGECDAAGRWTGLRIGLGGVDDTPILAVGAMATGEGSALEETMIARMAEACATQANPADDMRASASYRRHLLSVHVARMLRRLRDEGSAPRHEMRKLA